MYLSKNRRLEDIFLYINAYTKHSECHPLPFLSILGFVHLTTACACFHAVEGETQPDHMWCVIRYLKSYLPTISRFHWNPCILPIQAKIPDPHAVKLPIFLSLPWAALHGDRFHYLHPVPPFLIVLISATPIAPIPLPRHSAAGFSSFPSHQLQLLQRERHRGISCSCAIPFTLLHFSPPTLQLWSPCVPPLHLCHLSSSPSHQLLGNTGESGSG